MILGRVEKIFVGKPKKEPWASALTSISKQEVQDRQRVDRFGLVNDEQADKVNHGGAAMRLHAHPIERYAFWNNKFMTKLEAGAFGENFATSGLLEEQIYVGDICRIGTVTVQLSQGRVPCHKLCDHTDIKELAYWFQKTGYTGWYYRILETGHVQAADAIELIERPQSNLSLLELNKIFFTRKSNPDLARKVLEVEALSAEWLEKIRGAI